MTAYTNVDILGFESEYSKGEMYTLSEAVQEARRCLQCTVPQCRKGCPVENKIPQFIQAVSKGNIGEAASYIREHSCLPGICGRVCPREIQCEGSCVLGKKGRPVAIGKLERFVADMIFDGSLLPKMKNSSQKNLK